MITLTACLVIKQCGLERDLTLFEAGDLTEVGEKGLTLRLVDLPLVFHRSFKLTICLVAGKRFVLCAVYTISYFLLSTQARVTLARAIYSYADIILLDDVLAALDVHTARWVVENCFKGDLVKGRTILLVVCSTYFFGPFVY